MTPAKKMQVSLWDIFSDKHFKIDFQKMNLAFKHLFKAVLPIFRIKNLLLKMFLETLRLVIIL